jgi:hypothetical protein
VARAAGDDAPMYVEHSRRPRAEDFTATQLRSSSPKSLGLMPTFPPGSFPFAHLLGHESDAGAPSV